MAGTGIGRVQRRSTAVQSSPLTHHFIDVRKRRVVVRFGKKVTAQEIGLYAERLRTHPAFEPTFSEIVDLTEAEDLDLGSQDFLRLADKVDPFSPEAKRAFVVRTAVQQHAARMHKILRSTRKIEIFRSLEEAERWVEAGDGSSAIH